MVYSHDTAFELFRFFRYTRKRPLEQIQFNSCNRTIRNNPTVTKKFSPDKVHYISPSKSTTFRTMHFKGHYFDSEKFKILCNKYPDGITLVQPEMILLQMAGKLSYVQIFCLINEFCGTYSLCPDKFQPESANFDTSSKIKYGLEPACTTNSISKFIEKKQASKCRIAGTAKVKAVLQYCCDGSASPQETQIYGKLCLPKECGGLEIQGVHSNFPIKLGLSADEEFASDVRVDFCIPNKKLVIEYDSDEFHSSAEKIRRDQARRDALQLAGWNCYTLNSWQVRTREVFNEKLAEICKRHKIKFSLPTEFQENRQRLFSIFKRL